jgi:hypothetical protein
MLCHFITILLRRGVLVLQFQLQSLTMRVESVAGKWYWGRFLHQYKLLSRTWGLEGLIINRPFLSGTKLTTLTQSQHSIHWDPHHPPTSLPGATAVAHASPILLYFGLPLPTVILSMLHHIIYPLSRREHKTSFVLRNEEWWLLFRNWK